MTSHAKFVGAPHKSLDRIPNPHQILQSIVIFNVAERKIIKHMWSDYIQRTFTEVILVTFFNKFNYVFVLALILLGKK